MSFEEYIKDLVEEYTTVATEYGAFSSKANEVALAETSELLYKAIERGIKFSSTSIDKKMVFMLKSLVRKEKS